MAALFLGVGSSVFAQIEGKVYIDANGNGICDAGERGLKGVCVQDGLNVVKTTDDGHFILPGHKDTRFVTLTVPDGYQAVSYTHLARSFSKNRRKVFDPCFVGTTYSS